MEDETNVCHLSETTAERAEPCKIWGSVLFSLACLALAPHKSLNFMIGNVGITFREILHEAQSDYTSDLVSIRQLLIIKYCTY